MSKMGVLFGGLLSINSAFAQTGVKAYTMQDYATFVFGLVFIGAGSAIILSILKNNKE